MLGFEKEEAFTVIDLGAGGGRLLRRVLERYPRALGVWMDRSDEASGIARDFLGDISERVTFIDMELKDVWSPRMPETVDAIVSMSAIHHLDREGKQKIFRECYEHLSGRGVFINIDEIRDQDIDCHMRNIRYWADHVERMARSRPGTLIEEYYRRYCEKDDSDKAEQMVKGQWEKSVGKWVLHRKLETVPQLLKWLKAAGFTVVQTPVVYYMWACIYARK